MLTASRLRKLLSYSRSSGIFRWLIRSSNRVNIGDIAGTIDAAGYVVIKIAGQRYYAARLAVLHVTGQWPVMGGYRRSRDRADNRWRNFRFA